MSDLDRQLLFGVIALQNDLIDTRQFLEAHHLWTTCRSGSLADVLVEKGWLAQQARSHIEYLLAERCKKYRSEPPGREPPPELATLNISAPVGGKAEQPAQASNGGSHHVRMTPVLPPPPEKDRLTLLELLSTGGIGQVWQASDETFGRVVALKELKAEMARSPLHRERFIREARITGQLEHPGIVPVYHLHASEDGTRCYYTMRFLKGRTLTEVIREYHRDRLAGLTGRFVPLLQHFVSICNTIAYAHSRGVIHRDLKGDNIIVGDFGEVVVLDWGLAKHLDDGRKIAADEPYRGATLAHVEREDSLPESALATLQGERLGTPAYMAPEQATGQIDQIDTLTDVYGLAAILYEILVGEPPFLGTSIVEVIDKVIHQPPVPPRDRVSDVPVELESLCLRGLAKERIHRPASAAEMGACTQDWLTTRAERKRTEQEREHFFNLSLDLMAILDAEGHITQSNSAWHTILGWSGNELRGRPVGDYVHPEDRPRSSATINRILSGERGSEVELRCVAHDGSYRWIHWKVTLIRGESVLYIVGRDVSERKQAEQTFRGLLESAPDAMVVVEGAGRIVLVNTQMERLFGYGREEVLGQPIEVFVPEAYRASHGRNVEAYVANPAFRPMGMGLQLSGQHKDGRVFPVEISLSPVKTEQGLLICCAIRDRSPRSADSAGP
jgi:PAS domain S-box-containing protein